MSRVTYLLTYLLGTSHDDSRQTFQLTEPRSSSSSWMLDVFMRPVGGDYLALQSRVGSPG